MVKINLIVSQEALSREAALQGKLRSTEEELEGTRRELLQTKQKLTQAESRSAERT
jgi:hypothetical protein